MSKEREGALYGNLTDNFRAATRLQHLQVLVKKERELKFGTSEALLEQDLEKHLQELIDRNVELTDQNKKLGVIVKKMEKVGVLV